MHIVFYGWKELDQIRYDGEIGSFSRLEPEGMVINEGQFFFFKEIQEAIQVSRCGDLFKFLKLLIAQVINIDMDGMSN